MAAAIARLSKASKPPGPIRTSRAAAVVPPGQVTFCRKVAASPVVLARRGHSSSGGARPERRRGPARYLSADASAFAAILERDQASLLRFAANRLRGSASAEDVVQETFLRLLREASALNGNETLAAWLFRVCRNLCADAARKEVRMQERHLRVAVPDPRRPRRFRSRSTSSATR